jgi:adenylate kinase
MGVAGAGKSMQGRMLADERGWPWLSTGEFLRMLISGERRKQMLEGKLIGDSEIIAMVQKIFAVVDTDHEFVLDGFPRTAGQAEWLLAQAKYDQLEVTAVIHLKATEDVVRQRLLNRARQDDTHEAISERFREYHDEILPILEQFRSAGIPVCDIDGDQEVGHVHDAISKSMSSDADEG